MTSTAKNLIESGVRFASLSFTFVRDLIYHLGKNEVSGSVRRSDSCGHALYRACRRELEITSIVYPVPNYRIETIKANQQWMKPFLALAITGDEANHKNYLRERLAYLPLLPDWVSEECYRIAKSKYEDFSLKPYLTAAMRTCSFQLRPFTDSVYDGLMNEAFITIHDRRAFLAECKSDHFIGKVSKERLFFSLAHRCPLGNLARQIMATTTDFVQAAVVALDVAKILNVDFSQDDLLAISREDARRIKVGTPYYLASRFLELDHALSEFEGRISQAERTKAFRAAIGNPASAITHHIQSRMESKTIAAKKDCSSDGSPPTYFEDDTLPKLRNLVIDSLQEYMHYRDQSQARLAARDLYKAIRREAITLSDAITCLQRGMSADEVLSQIAIDKPKPPPPPPPPPPKPSTPAVASYPVELPSIPAVAEDTNRIVLSSEFLTWFATITDKVDAARIEDKLAKFRSGNAGKSKTVSGTSIIELKVSRFRIYLEKIDDSTYNIILGGDKASQVRDTASIRDRFQH